MPFALKTIAWDVDDVLNDLMRQWFSLQWLRGHPECKVTYEELAENPPHRIIGADLHSYLESLDEFRLSDLYQQMPPVKEVKEWFEKNGHNFRHIALTAVPLIAASASAQWVFKHFGPWIRTFHFVPSKREGDKMPAYDNDKGAFLKWIQKVDILVDDSYANIQAARSAGVKGIILPRPWNKSLRQGEEGKEKRAKSKGQRAEDKEEGARATIEALKELENIGR
jgi:FMN phosphatase YigB (HAD superfamily)